uniref:uncharacterized protein LOC122609286 n=1 Tax=Erigeron canadensis TaxID=72917 RepID=UPI001CB921B1|nr:uncharacterized protein LOC122609286 [Erigeron canadensis]
MCPTAWRGSHTRGDVGRPSLMLQAVASTDLWIWNAYFGQQGSNNDINVFEASPVLEEIISGLAPIVGFYANNNYYKAGYYLTDGIYPEYSTFVKTFTDSIDEKRKYFKKKQESTRKDIERAFRVLKKRWKHVSFPSRFWDKQRMHDVIYACITLHNMILENEDKAFCQDFNDEDPTLDPAYWEQQTSMEQQIANSQVVRNSQTHNMLLADLVDHLWENKRGNHPPYMPLEVDDYFSDDD